jgi:hypothetical protein
MSEGQHSAEEVRAPLSYLEKGVTQWEGRITADAAVDVYKLLARLDPNGMSKYLAEVQKWEYVRLHREHLKRIPELAKNGQFFILFQDYWNAMRFWGLATDTSAKELRPLLVMSPAERRGVATEWKRAAGRVPTPLVRRGSEIYIVAEFLRLGICLFSPPNDTDDDFNRGREQLNAAAGAALPMLLTAVVALPGLPEAIKELIARHRRSVEQFTPIAGLTTAT